MALVNSYASYDGNLRAIKLLNLEWSDYNDWEKKYSRQVNPEMVAMMRARLGFTLGAIRFILYGKT